MRFSKLSVCLALLVAACLPVHAEDQMRVTIPFAFTTAGKWFPAGEYRFATAFSSDRKTWVMYGDHQFAYLYTDGVESPVTSHVHGLTFRQFGGQFALVQIWPDGHRGRSVMVQQPKIAKQGSEVQVAAE
jgi:hypothetical protein